MYLGSVGFYTKKATEAENSGGQLNQSLLALAFCLSSLHPISRQQVLPEPTWLTTIKIPIYYLYATRYICCPVLSLFLSYTHSLPNWNAVSN